MELQDPVIELALKVIFPLFIPLLIDYSKGYILIWFFSSESYDNVIKGLGIRTLVYNIFGTFIGTNKTGVENIEPIPLYIGRRGLPTSAS